MNHVSHIIVYQYNDVGTESRHVCVNCGLQWPNCVVGDLKHVGFQFEASYILSVSIYCDQFTLP